MNRVPGGDNLVKVVQCYELFGEIALKNHTFFSLFVDDVQIGTSILPQHVHSAISSVEICISDVKYWMIENKLQLNDEKTDVFLYVQINAHKIKLHFSFIWTQCHIILYYCKKPRIPSYR